MNLSLRQILLFAPILRFQALPNRIIALRENAVRSNIWPIEPGFPGPSKHPGSWVVERISQSRFPLLELLGFPAVTNSERRASWCPHDFWAEFRTEKSWRRKSI